MARPTPVVIEDSQMLVKKDHRGQHPNSRANLKPFKPGENGNHAKGYSLTQALRDALGNPKERRKLIQSTLEGAIRREPTSQNIVWDRVDGKLVEQHALIGKLVIEVEYVDRSKQIEGT